MLSQVTNEVNVEALPMEVPEHLEVDVSEMAIGDTLRLSPFTAPAGVTFLDDLEETVVATVTAPMREEEPEPVEGAEGAEGEAAEAERLPRARARALPRAATPRAAPTASPAPSRAKKPLMRLWPRRHGTSLDLLVVGLGNPGREYARNRHNLGWMVVDELARRHNGTWRAKFNGQLAEIRIDGHKVALLKPETFMNDSGRSVQAALKFFKLEPDPVLVVHDEGDLDAAAGCRHGIGGGSGGHNGLRSITQHLGTPDFLRLRVGVGRPGRGDQRPLADYLLADFLPEDDADPSRHGGRRRRRDARRRGSRGRAARRSTANVRNTGTRNEKVPGCSGNAHGQAVRPAHPVSDPHRPTPLRDGRPPQRVVAGAVRHC